MSGSPTRSTEGSDLQTTTKDPGTIPET